MGRQTHQLVHHQADELGAAGHLDAEGLLDAHAHAVTVDVGGHVVHALGVEEHLGIGQALTHLLDAAVDVSADDVDLLHRLAVEAGTVAHHAVGGRVLRADVDNILVVLKDLALHLLDLTVLVLDPAAGVVLVGLVLETQGVAGGVVVLAQGVTHPVVAQEHAAHVGVTDEDDAIEVIHLALLEVGHGPQVHNAVQHGILTVGGGDLDVQQLVGGDVGQVVNAATGVGPFHAHNGVEHAIVQLVLESAGQVMPLCVGHGHQRELAGSIDLSLGTQLGDFVLYLCHIVMFQFFGF